MAIDRPFQPAQGPLTSEKSTTGFTPTPLFPPRDPFFRTPAHVSFIRHVCGFQGLSERLLFFHMSTMDERSPLSLYSLLLLSFALLSIHSSVVLSQINFCHSQRGPDRGNQSWPFRKKKKKPPLCTLLNQLVTFNYDKWNWINKTSNELSCSKDNRGTRPSVAGFWIALEMNGGHYYSVCVCVCEWECVFYVVCLWGGSFHVSSCCREVKPPSVHGLLSVCVCENIFNIFRQFGSLVAAN